MKKSKESKTVYASEEDKESIKVRRKLDKEP